MLLASGSERGPNFLCGAAQKFGSQPTVASDEEGQESGTEVRVAISTRTVLDQLAPGAFDMPPAGRRDAVLGASSATRFCL
ncbi:MAG TPA: hypothetical protein VFJ10_17740 [Acidobacteriaceae bacterium]|nr:hypothetical protein [Acidobacteriaceae bacterium]